MTSIRPVNAKKRPAWWGGALILFMLGGCSTGADAGAWCEDPQTADAFLAGDPTTAAERIPPGVLTELLGLIPRTGPLDEYVTERCVELDRGSDLQR